MPTDEDEIHDIVRGWNFTKTPTLRLVYLSHAFDQVIRSALITLNSEPTDPKDSMTDFVNYLETIPRASEARIVADHIDDWLAFTLGGRPVHLYFASSFDEWYSKDADSREQTSSAHNEAKHSRDSRGSRQQVRPRMHLWLRNYCMRHQNETELIAESMNALTEWAQARRVFSSLSENGFLSLETLAIMFLVTLEREKRSNKERTVLSLVKKFFEQYSMWNYNEGSVGSHCCRPAGFEASFILEKEGLDSDDEERDPPTPQESSSLNDESDEVHPHKRLRYELGQIRDIRRYYEVENSKVAKISIRENHDGFAALDWLDVVSVMHPCEDVNLAIRVLESHKKLIVQEMLRAHHILEDQVTGIPEALVSKTPYRRASSYIVFQIRAESEFILHSVASVVDNQNWFLIQELQAHAGILLTPSGRFHQLQDGSAIVITGLTFVSDEPYSAVQGLRVDVSGAMSRVLVRSRKLFRDRSDFVKMEKKFSVTCKVVRCLPGEWLDSLDSQF